MFPFLQNRELGKSRKEPFVNSHGMYRHIYPQYTTYNTCAAHIAIRKFSPCGRFLIAFANNQHSIHIYDYVIPSEATNGGISPQFNDFFTLRFEITLTAGSETLCFDFCMFTSTKKYVILCSAVPCTDRHTRRSPESLSNVPNLDNISFWVVELESGKVIGIN
jgi:hypothetical protein